MKVLVRLYAVLPVVRQESRRAAVAPYGSGCARNEARLPEFAKEPVQGRRLVVQNRCAAAAAVCARLGGIGTGGRGTAQAMCAVRGLHRATDEEEQRQREHQRAPGEQRCPGDARRLRWSIAGAVSRIDSLSRRW